MGAVGTDRSVDPGVQRCTTTAMGSRLEILVRGGRDGIVDEAVARVRELEARWSRFVPDSDVSRLARRAGDALSVHPDTLLLVELAIDGWRRTDGRFDPSILPVLRHIGYDTDLAAVLDRDPARTPPTVDPPVLDPLATGRIEIDRRAGTVRLPQGTSFDAGGIGKGLAADLTAHWLAARGVEGGCVNVGGDVRAFGEGPHDGTWRIGTPSGTIAVVDGAVATSSTRRRRWVRDGTIRHHVIDPSTASPAADGTVVAVARAAWWADVCALAALALPPEQRPAALQAWGVDAFVVEPPA
jgi:thiamine biosynthesis lipoprotein